MPDPRLRSQRSSVWVRVFTAEVDGLGLGFGLAAVAEAAAVVVAELEELEAAG